MTKSPTVSVVLPVRGDGCFLEEAITSISNQTLSDFELIIVDNGLDHEGREVMRRSNGMDDRIRVMSQEGGLARVLDAGCRAARAPLIARMDGDDIASPDRLARQVEHMNRSPGCVACGTWVMLMDESGKDVRLKQFPVGPADARALLKKWPCIAHASAMIRKEAYLRAGGYQIWYRFAEDYALWVRMAALGDFENIPIVGLRRRIHDGSISARFADRQLITTMKIRADVAINRLGSNPVKRVRLREVPYILRPQWSRLGYNFAKRDLGNARLLAQSGDTQSAGRSRKRAHKWIRHTYRSDLWIGFFLHYLKSFKSAARR